MRSSCDRVADNYVAMGVGDLEPTPWLRAALAVFAEDVRGLEPVLDVGCTPACGSASPQRQTWQLDEASLGGVLGWWSLFNLPRDLLPGVLATFARSLVPGGQVLLAARRAH